MQWKIAEIILKTENSQTSEKSYRSIRLLLVPFKVFEKLLLKRLTPILDNKNGIPDYSFEFRQNHATAFLDIIKLFIKSGTMGLLFILKKCLHNNYFINLKSYIENRHFFFKYIDE